MNIQIIARIVYFFIFGAIQTIAIFDTQKAVLCLAITTISIIVRQLGSVGRAWPCIVYTIRQNDYIIEYFYYYENSGENIKLYSQLARKAFSVYTIKEYLL